MKKIIILAVLLALCSSALAQQPDYYTTGEGSTQIKSGETWKVITRELVPHTIRLIDVTEKGDACGIEVDGYTAWVYVGKEKTINGVYVKVFEAYPVHSFTKDNDACKLFIGGTVSRYYEPNISRIPLNETATEEKAAEIPEHKANETIRIVSVEETTEFKPLFAVWWEKIIGFFKWLFS